MRREGRERLTWGQRVNLSPAETGEEWGWGLVCGVGRGDLGSLWREDVAVCWTLCLPSGLVAQGWSRTCPLGSGGERRQEAGIKVNSVLLEDSPRPCPEPRITVRDTQSGTT